MNNKTYFIIQLTGLAFLYAAVVIQVLMFLNVSARIAAIEQNQGVLERRMNVLQDAQINISINLPLPKSKGLALRPALFSLCVFF
jgi:hypothetical protein